MSDHLSSSDEDLEEFLEVVEVPKSIRYFEEIIPQLTNEQYLQHFRMNRHVVEELAERFKNSEYFHLQEGDSEKVSPLKFITTFLWFSANESASYRDVADRFNISKSTLHKVVKRVTYFLSNLAPEVIKWPSYEEKLEIERFFREKNFPGVIGVIDGTHIRIDAPKEDPDSYLNRKHFHSIQAQVVCDHYKRIRDIFVGYPGSVHDSTVFRTSPLCESLADKCHNMFILGDSGYPCLRHLLTPFKDRGQLTRRQRNYNYLLSRNRYIIEHCFGHLKQKFRQLYHLKLRKIEDAVHFIRACIVLHNLSIDDEFIYEDIPEEHVLLEQPHQVEEEKGDDRDGIAKRNEVVTNLPFVM